MWPSTDNGCAWPARRESATSYNNVYYCAFDGAADEYAEFSIVLPDWDAGTVTATFYWTTTSAVANATVCWGIAGRSFANDDALDQAYPASTNAAADVRLAAADVHVITTGAHTVTGAGASEYVQFRATRVTASDDMAADADLLGVLITYTRA
jgi:hypothetical protein